MMDTHEHEVAIAVTNDVDAQAAADLTREDILFLRATPPLLTELRTAIDEAPDGTIRVAAAAASVALWQRFARIARRDLPAK
jgi:sporulation-control protein spo0M